MSSYLSSLIIVFRDAGWLDRSPQGREVGEGGTALGDAGPSARCMLSPHTIRWTAQLAPEEEVPKPVQVSV
ncbi:MAG: hypothetical protein ACOYKZ_03005 [Chlamydiia bacterium]